MDPSMQIKVLKTRLSQVSTRTLANIDPEIYLENNKRMSSSMCIMERVPAHRSKLTKVISWVPTGRDMVVER